MKISDEGIRLIKQFEGLELHAYKDIVGVLTVGYGSTGSHVRPGMVITEQEAEDLLLQDLVRFEECVTDALEIDVTQQQFDALVSFAFNLGCKAMSGSTLMKLVNAGDSAAAAQQFARWSKAGGKEVAGLVRRRQAEKELFLA